MVPYCVTLKLIFRDYLPNFPKTLKIFPLCDIHIQTNLFKAVKQIFSKIVDSLSISGQSWFILESASRIATNLFWLWSASLPAIQLLCDNVIYEFK